jgi:hypothetical protein
MLKKTIKYKDYNGVEREEDFYFNLTKTEITKLEFSRAGGLAEHIRRITQAQDGTEIMELLDEILKKAYGEKSEDGKHFHKDPERYKLFTETEAYNILFMELCMNAESAANFVNAVIPAD